MSGIIILSTLSILAIAAVVTAVIFTLRDGYHRIPTRSL
ncbi:MAG: hypothetical protein JWN80_2321 [Microbacteriaceae bacterium]|nr:hypothetical protein [Microbacteriaceae bacterium]